MIHKPLTQPAAKRISILTFCCVAVALAQTGITQDGQYKDAKDPQPGQRTGVSGQQSGQQFVQQATLGGLKEVRLGQIAQQQAQDSEVKQFAQQMVQDHSMANQKLAQLARSKGYTIPSTNTFTAGATGTDREYVREREAARPGVDQSRPGVRPDSEAIPPTPGTPGTYDRQRVGDTQSQASPEQHRQTIQRLQSLSGTEFDRAYMGEMVKSHAKAVQVFQNASQNLQDAELKQFASETLPKLTHHHQMAQQLAAKLGSDGQNRLNQDKNENDALRNEQK